jgi:hypothetical protein
LLDVLLQIANKLGLLKKEERKMGSLGIKNGWRSFLQRWWLVGKLL